MIDIFASNNAPHQIKSAKALKAGLLSHGVDCRVIGSGRMIKSKTVACWGWRKGKQLRDSGKNVLVMERSYIGDRFHYYSLGWNGLNGHATFPEHPDDGGERFRSHGGIIKPWKKDGKYVLILGQVKNDASLQGMDVTGWYLEMAEKAKIHGFPVYFRPHPESARRGGYDNIGIPELKGTLDDALSGAKFTIAFNSNSCLDSILAGVPCYAGDKGTMAYDLCMKDIAEIVYPERESLVHKIAFTQWTLDEIASGLPIKGLLECGQF